MAQFIPYGEWVYFEAFSYEEASRYVKNVLGAKSGFLLEAGNNKYKFMVR